VRVLITPGISDTVHNVTASVSIDIESTEIDTHLGLPCWQRVGFNRCVGNHGVRKSGSGT
jgi:hypothetical protein